MFSVDASRPSLRPIAEKWTRPRLCRFPTEETTLLDLPLTNVHNEQCGLVARFGVFVVVFRGELMDRLQEYLTANVVLSLAGLAILVAVAAYVIGLVRPKSSQHEPKASELMSKFRESHSKGNLSDEEFRTIKSTLAAQLKDELKDNGETG